jgi:hypothetical protein
MPDGEITQPPPRPSFIPAALPPGALKIGQKREAQGQWEGPTDPTAGWRPAHRRPPGIGPPPSRRRFILPASFSATNPEPRNRTDHIPASRQRGPPGLPARFIRPDQPGEGERGDRAAAVALLGQLRARFPVRRRESRRESVGESISAASLRARRAATHIIE